MLQILFPQAGAFLQETTPQNIPMPSGTVLLLIFLALVFIVAWRLIANLESAPLHESAHSDHATPHAGSRAQSIELTPDDLTIVEGIGPKIGQLLHENGIHTFSELAETSPEFLAELLRTHHIPGSPVTWPEQARLAALGDWDGLKTLQQNLTAGRRA